MKRPRKPMQPIITRKLAYSQFKITETLFQQAAALAKYKCVSIFSLLTDYLTIGIVSASEAVAFDIGEDEWIEYCKKAWAEVNRIEKPLPRFKKRGLISVIQPLQNLEQQPQGETQNV